MKSVKIILIISILLFISSCYNAHTAITVRNTKTAKIDREPLLVEKYVEYKQNGVMLFLYKIFNENFSTQIEAINLDRYRFNRAKTDFCPNDSLAALLNEKYKNSDNGVSFGNEYKFMIDSEELLFIKINLNDHTLADFTYKDRLEPGIYFFDIELLDRGIYNIKKDIRVGEKHIVKDDIVYFLD